MDKAAVDWAGLGYHYIRTDYRYQAEWLDGKWTAGELVTDNTVTLCESSSALHYAQECFEGIKAVTAEDGHINLFRINLNAERFQESCRRVLIPELPAEQFIESVFQVVRANKKWVPPYDPDLNTALYIRPYAFGHGEMHGAKAAPKYIYRCYCLPVGAHFGEMKPVRLLIPDYDRAAPNGSGGNKVGANYAEGLLPAFLARKQGYEECLYLDSQTHTKIEETGGANFVAVLENGKMISPKSDTILNSVTRRSLLQIARDYMGMDAGEEVLYVSDLDHVKEAFLCGTGAAVTPVAGVMTHQGYKQFGDGKAGQVTKEIFRIYKGIQRGLIEAPQGWIYSVE